MRLCHRRSKITSKVSLPVTFLGVLIIVAGRYMVYFLSELHSIRFLSCTYVSHTRDNRIYFENSQNFLYDYPEFICPQNFRNLADWVYGWPDGVFREELEYLDKAYDSWVPNLPNGSILYVKTDKLRPFFEKIYPNIRNEFVLITGQGDHSAPKKYLQYLHALNSRIIHWFGQNGDIYPRESEKFTHIPIGKQIISFFSIMVPSVCNS